MSEKTSGESPVNPLPIAAAVYPTNEPFDASSETAIYSRSEAHDRLLSLGYTGGVAERFLNDAAHTLETMEPTSSAAKVLRAFLRNPLARWFIARVQAAKELRALGVGDYSTVQLLDNAQAWLSGENGPLVEAFATILRAYVRGLEAQSGAPAKGAETVAAQGQTPPAPAARETIEEEVSRAAADAKNRYADICGRLGPMSSSVWDYVVRPLATAKARLAEEVRTLRVVRVERDLAYVEIKKWTEATGAFAPEELTAALASHRVRVAERAAHPETGVVRDTHRTEVVLREMMHAYERAALEFGIDIHRKDGTITREEETRYEGMLDDASVLREELASLIGLGAWDDIWGQWNYSPESHLTADLRDRLEGRRSPSAPPFEQRIPEREAVTAYAVQDAADALWADFHKARPLADDREAFLAGIEAGRKM